MKTLQQRFALLAGVSVCALYLPTPAAAAPLTGILDLVNGENVDDLLVISAVDDPAAIYGVTAEGTSMAYAIVSSPSNGEIAQVGNAYGAGPTDGFLTMTASNAGVVTIEGVADASNTDGAATARAHVERAVTQNGSATTKSAITLNNEGSLSIDADAHAAGTSALALATMSTGVLQNAAGPIADIGLSNEGEIEISAIAGAIGTAANAIASASAIGIEQHAYATDSGAIALSNDGTIGIDIGAIATGFVTAEAHAQVRAGVIQSATGMDPIVGYAGADLDNGGTLDIGAAASADAQVKAVAGAHVGTAIYQHATASGGGADVSLSNGGTMDIAATAHAVGHNDGSRSAVATASAIAGGIFQAALAKTQYRSSGTSSGVFYFEKNASPHGPVSINLDNSGSISLVAAASATGDDHALAKGAVTAVMQVAEGSDAAVELTNSGSIEAAAHGFASGGHAATADGFASGLHQTASAHSSASSVIIAGSSSAHFGSLSGGVGPAHVSLSNSGTYDLVATAEAVVDMAATGSSNYAAATAHIGIGILQQAFGSDAQAVITNDGAISMSAAAQATAPGYAIALADANGFSQVAIATAFVRSINFHPSSVTGFSGSAYVGPAFDEFSNSGTLEVAAIGKALGESSAQANVHATGGLQLANGATAIAVFDNSGTFSVIASGHATAGNEFAFAAAHGVAQWEKGLDSALERIVNDGTFSVSAIAKGSATQGMGWEHAAAAGFLQNPLSLGTATASLMNSGKINVLAEAEGVGATFANASATASGISQSPLFGPINADFANEGSFDVAASAKASAESGAAYAMAIATGMYVDAGHVTADVLNKGELSVSAVASAAGDSGSAYAYAGGISIVAANHASASSVAAGTLDGSIVNSGELDVSARVSATDGGTVGATATGIYLLATRNNATVVNSGSINVDAVTANGVPANATGVHVVTGFRGSPATAADVFTFTNDGGDIIVRNSIDGGETWTRGMAIDVAQAPNASVINLIGNGKIYGDIAIQANDEINVEAGKTYFDGIIDPSVLPAGGITAADLDTGIAGIGTLNIANGGNLVLADPRVTGDAATYDGPAYAFVDTLNVASDGTLTFELQPLSGGVQSVGSYGQLFADTVKLDGTLEADLATPDGLFADSYSWQNVIDANSLSGSFDRCKLGGDYAGSLFLKFSCSLDSNANVDLSLTRVGFDSVGGLNANGRAVAAALEADYQPGMNGGPAKLYADLFRITDATDYGIAANQLSGSAYANYLQSFSSLGVHYNDLLDQASECSALARSVPDCRGGPLRVWGQLDYQWRKAGGDSEGGTMASTRFTGQLGIDAAVADNLIVGVAAGGVNNHSRDRQFGDAVNADGMQVGGYAGYDAGAFFAKAVTTYSWYDGKSTRQIDFTPFGGTLKGNPAGNPDARLWTLGLHAGARLPFGATVATPYFNLDYAQARLKSFTESGLDGANLTVEGGRSDHTFLTGGVKLAAAFGAVTPEVNLGYRYRLGNSRSRVTAALFGDTSNGFDIVSASQKRATFLASVGVGGRIGPVDLRVSYQGEFNGDVTSHGGNFRLTLPFGGARVAPRRPPVVAPPPPPPAEAPVPPPSAAPAEAEHNERGS